MIVRTTRAQIKAYMADKISTPDQQTGVFPTLVDNRVFIDRYGPLQQGDLPAILIYVIEESCEMLDTVSDRKKTKLQMELCAAGDDADTQLDILSDQVYDLFRNDEYLGANGIVDGLVEWCRYVHGQLYYDEKRHLDALYWLMDYDIHHIWETVPDPEVSNMADFRTMDVTTGFSAGDPAPGVVLPESEQIITILQ